MYIWAFLVPIVAKGLRNIGDFATVVIFGHEFTIQLVLPFSWFVFYLSALAFALANIIYVMRCPQIIQEHRDYFGFYQAGKGFEHLHKYVFEIGCNWEGLRQFIARQQQYFDDVAEVSNPGSSDEHLKNYFWATYTIADETRASWKIAAFILYTIGIILIAYVFLQNLAFVGTYVFGSASA